MGGKIKNTKTKAGNGADLYFFIHELLKRREALLPKVKEFQDIDSALKEYFTGVPSFVIGNYSIKGGWAVKTGKGKVWKTDIKKIDNK
ncbi:hypothetical protein AAIR98_000953 [Elusimicrobium simillimum]|uniref:hypothetical protein n=1 Tax=Elusimicrobium simillimum TaxID=3143438 RepID=UPI003C6F6B9E